MAITSILSQYGCLLLPTAKQLNPLHILLSQMHPRVAQSNVDCFALPEELWELNTSRMGSDTLVMQIRETLLPLLYNSLN